MMKFFTFVQNNSGGVFSGPAQYVIVEAANAEDANDRAEAVGLYFDGAVEDADGYSRDCPCCGSRWHRQYADDEGDPSPMIYGKPAAESPYTGRILIVYADGRQENA